MTDNDHLYRRHGELVDKKFLDGLSPEEEQELAEIRRQLDEHEAAFYRPMEAQARAALAALEAELRGRSNDG